MERHSSVSVIPLPRPLVLNHSTTSGQLHSAKQRDRSVVLQQPDFATLSSNGELGYQTVIDLTQLPFFKLLFPSHFFPETFCCHLDRYLNANWTTAHCQLIAKCRAAGLHPEKREKSRCEKVVAAHALLSDIRNLVAPLNRLGQQLRVLYEEETGSPLADVRVSDVCTVQNAPYTASKLMMLNSDRRHYIPLTLEVANQQRISYPVWKHGVPSTTRTGTIKYLKKLIEQKLAQVGIDKKSPEFLGFIPPKLANKTARTAAFTDSLWSLNLFHGEETHRLQLVILSDLGLMDRSLLKQLVDNYLWTYLLDQNLLGRPDGYAVVNPTEHDQLMLKELQSDLIYPVSRIHLRGGWQALTANSPESLHCRLLTGAFSSALKTLSAELDVNDQAALLQNVIGITADEGSPCTSALSECEKNLAAIEWAITEEQLHTMDKIASFMEIEPDQTLFETHDATTGNFCTATTFESVIREKAARCIKEGRRIEGISSAESRPEKLHHSSNLKRYHSFIIHPREGGE